MHFRRHLVLFLATGAYIGKIPIGPGTFGSLWGIPLAVALSGMRPAVSALLTLAAIVAAIVIAGEAEKILDRKDPGAIVIDEIAGMLVTFLALPITPVNLAAGFFLFRIFDIIKPFPARSFERGFSGGAGVVLDDVAAGVYANIVLRIGLLVLGPPA